MTSYYFFYVCVSYLFDHGVYRALCEDVCVDVQCLEQILCDVLDVHFCDCVTANATHDHLYLRCFAGCVDGHCLSFFGEQKVTSSEIPLDSAFYVCCQSV